MVISLAVCNVCRSCDGITGLGAVFVVMAV